MSLAVEMPGSAVAMLGSGKMARNIGLWFVRAGHRVTFFPSTKHLSDECGLYVQKKFKRLQDVFGGSLFEPRVCLADAAGSGKFDIIVEATAESLEVKQRRFSAISPLITPRTLLCTATSSILPGRIGPDCVGMHFFYPVELTGFVELVAENTTPKDRTERLKAFADSCSLSYIVEDEKSAFCANRILLPLQAEALRMVQQGFAATEIDACTVSDLLPQGQLSLMDTVGLDVIYAGVCNYLTMMAPQDQTNFKPLAEALKSMIDQGKLGRKNKNCLLPTKPQKRAEHGMDAAARSSLAKTFLYLFVNTCCSFLERRIIDGQSLDEIIARAFQASSTLSGTIAQAGGATIADHCNSRFLETGISYFKPSRLLSR